MQNPSDSPPESVPPPPMGLSDNVPSDAGQEEKVRTLLLQRPRFSVRLRLVLLLSAIFVVAAAVTVTSLFMLSKVDRSVALVALTEQFAFEAEEARRYEKNFFLYGSDLGEAARHTDNADRILQKAAGDIRPVVGSDQLEMLRQELQTYRQLIAQLISKADEAEFHGSTEFKEIVGALRDNGSQMISRAVAINKAERREIADSMTLARQLTVAIFVLLLFICVYSGVHIHRHIIRRLTRLTDATRRFAGGDFSPIMPMLKYRDEFSNLAIALNHMMYELERRQRILVESHKIRAVGNLTAGVAHELNNPLNNIMLTSAMLVEDWEKLTRDARLEMVRELIEQAERARSIVRNLLDFARETESRVEQMTIEGVLEEVLRLAQNQVKISRIKLHLEVTPNLPSVYGDRSQLVQLFLNLILNAIDAMPRGGHLIVRTGREKETNSLCVHVQDTGPGIPPHLLQSVFDPFFTTKAKGKGTGLGLSMAQGIATHHGGHIDVMSKQGVGTTFTVYLPCVAVPAELDRKPNGANHAKEPPPAADSKRD